MSSPPPKSLVPVDTSTVWPPSNPSGTLIPFPLPWGQTGCCPPGGMDALMKCYCDIQQASAFIGQVMLDQINNNPAIIAAIIAGIENSGSSLPTLGVTNGQPAQPGQVGEYVSFASPNLNYNTTATTLSWTAGVLQPGDWDVWAFLQLYGPGGVADCYAYLNPVPAGVALAFRMSEFSGGSFADQVWLVAPAGQALISVPSLFNFTINVNQSGAGPSAGQLGLQMIARRRR